jgi:hypothetical protein
MLMTPEIGKVYARKRHAKAEVVRVTALADGWVEFRYLHGPTRALRAVSGRCKARNFAAAGWQPAEERADYSHLDGAARFPTFLALDTQGSPILRCSQKRAMFYLRKGYAREVATGVLQFLDAQTEDRLKVLYLGRFSDFFLAVKNDRCACCGAGTDLTRHHVVPQRHKKTIPQPWRSCSRTSCSSARRATASMRTPRSRRWSWAMTGKGTFGPGRTTSSGCCSRGSSRRAGTSSRYGTSGR